MILYKKYFFDGAHYMPNFPQGHRYREIHGHSYEMVIHLDGKIIENQGWITDFDKIDKIVHSIINIIDHKLLNDIEGLSIPTSENIAVWFWNKLKPDLPNIQKIEINRPRIGGCIYSG